MKTITKKVKGKKIVSIGPVEFGEWDIKEFIDIPFSIFIYSYEHEYYEGSGFSAWKVGKDWFYHELAHCSCNGPTDGINISGNAPLKFAELKVIVDKNYNDHGKNVISFIEKKKLK